MAGVHERPLLHEKPWFHGPVRAIEREVHDGIGVLERAACIRVGLPGLSPVRREPVPLRQQHSFRPV